MYWVKGPVPFSYLVSPSVISGLRVLSPSVISKTVNNKTARNRKSGGHFGPFGLARFVRVGRQIARRDHMPVAGNAAGQREGITTALSLKKAASPPVPVVALF
jgi:hypothetical protein